MRRLQNVARPPGNVVCDQGTRSASSRREDGWEDRPERWGPYSMAGHHVEVHLVILPMAFLLAISATAAKRSFAASQRISGQLVIRATNRPSRRTAGFGCSEGFGMVTTNLASKHI
jgi:hypothetical protein